MGVLSMSNSVELYACLYARELPAQALLRLRPDERDKAVVVLEGEPPLQTVCSFNAKARSMGITRGMTRVELETFSSVVLLPRSISEEYAARAALLECAGTFSPRVEDRSERTAFLCVIDIAGTELIFGTPQALAHRLLKRVRDLGVIASIAISRNAHAATSQARSNSKQITLIAGGSEADALSPLPLSVLNLSEQQAETFSLWGIRTLGALAALPERELIARMGQEGKRLRQLARGELPHLFVPVEPEFSLVERMELDTPVELLDSLLFVLGLMMEQLIMRATGRVLALASVTAKLSLEGGTTHDRTVRPALPSNDRQLWIKLLHLDLEAHPPQAAILAVTLEAEPGITSKVQLGLFSPQLPESTRLDVTLARIRAIVGEECVGKIVLKDTHKPDSFRIEPFVVPSKTAATQAPGQSVAAMRQLRPTERVSITLRDRQLSTITFREKRYEVEHAYGPWRANGDWWNPTPWKVEQWDVIARSSEGVPLCCCLVRDKQLWQVVGLYD
jgi:protein ImuB